jgi:hypothetical protein
MPAKRIVHLPAGGGTEAAMGRYSLVARFSARCERPEVRSTWTAGSLLAELVTAAG